MTVTDLTPDTSEASSLSPIQVDRPVGFADIFKIGIGPSSSHTMGPMKAAASFMRDLGDRIAYLDRLSATALGSLAWTGKGHATDKAIVLGFAGHLPHAVDPDDADYLFREITETRRLSLPGQRIIEFDPKRDIAFDTASSHGRHPNAMTFEAFDKLGRTLLRQVWFSIGGGFVECEGADVSLDIPFAPIPFPYSTAEELLAVGNNNDLRIDEIVLANETIGRAGKSTIELIDQVAETMFACIERGLKSSGELPGGLQVKRRAKLLYESLQSKQGRNELTSMEVMNYVSAFAIAVNEENAAGGRVVTAPTNGAAGVCPAVLRYYRDFCQNASHEGIRRFLLTATAIGGLIKRNASISGAEVGCQGEVGSAAAMAAAGLTAALGGTNAQIENAAEIAMEHHLGMTCDPIGGLVQIPCIERNAFGAVKAITAASLALQGDGVHRVSLDQVIETMRQTGLDMSAKYRETSRGGLAINVPEC